jgi:hypothetical protein
LNKARTILAIVLVLVAASIGIAYAVYTFTQTVPTVTVNSVSPNCTVLNNETPATQTAETLYLDCGASGLPVSAFTAQASTATPTFTLPSPYVDLYVYLNPSGQSCAGVTSQASPFNTPLVSGTPVSLVAGSYSYCLTYTGATLGQTLSTFTVTWTG